jgi:homoserine O-acetyltransferase
MKELCRALVLFLGLLLARAASFAADERPRGYPAPTSGDYILKDFHFRSGESLASLRMHYRALGTPRKDEHGVVRNAVLILHGTTGSGAQFMNERFAGELFGPAQLLDVSHYYVIIPDDIGHGNSSKPSDGLHAKFPRYGYLDMVEAEYLLLTTGLGIDHLRLVMGTSMGGMHTWLWGEEHPEMVDALMPLASLPSQVAGRNRVWRRMVIDAIRGDPAWRGGEYLAQPPSLRTAGEILYFMGSNPVLRQREGPTLAQMDALLDASLASYLKASDANDVLYAVEASRDYDPGPKLDQIRAPLVAINSADDLINPPELGILEREVRRVPHGRAVVIPMSERTVGHGTHTVAAIWKDQLARLLAESDSQR